MQRYLIAADDNSKIVPRIYELFLFENLVIMIYLGDQSLMHWLILINVSKTLMCHNIKFKIVWHSYQTIFKLAEVELSKRFSCSGNLFMEQMFTPFYLRAKIQGFNLKLANNLIRIFLDEHIRVVSMRSFICIVYRVSLFNLNITMYV